LAILSHPSSSGKNILALQVTVISTLKWFAEERKNTVHEYFHALLQYLYVRNLVFIKKNLRTGKICDMFFR
jgi:hypothetical protein